MSSPFSLPEDLVTNAQQERSSRWLSDISAGLDTKINEGMQGLKQAAGVAVEPIKPIARALASGGLTVPSLDDLTPTWMKDQFETARQATSNLASGVTLPSLADLTPGSSQPSGGTPAAMPSGQDNGGIVDVTPDEPVNQETVTRSAAAALTRAGLPASMAPYVAGIAINEGILKPGTIARDHWSVGGVKAPGSTGSVTVPTREVINGQSVMQTASFGTFKSMQEGMDALATFIRDSPRFGPVVKAAAESGDYAGMIEGFHQKGYATDPNWTRQVTSIAAGLPAPKLPPARPAAGQPAAMPQQSAQAGAGLDTQTIIKEYAGVPYTFGGGGGRSNFTPGAATDCSGFVASVWKNEYGLDLPAHTDAAYNALRSNGAPEVHTAEARPGDVVFYMGAGTGGAITHHMGIYAGNGKVLDMSVSGGSGVRERDIGHAGRFVILRDPRINPTEPKSAMTPPPIMPSADSGGMALKSRADADALALAAPAPAAPSPPQPDAGASDLDAQLASLRADPNAARGASLKDDGAPQPPARDDWRNDPTQPYDPREADQGPHEALPGSVGAQPVASPPGQNETLNNSQNIPQPTYEVVGAGPTAEPPLPGYERRLNPNSQTAQVPVPQSPAQSPYEVVGAGPTSEAPPEGFTRVRAPTSQTAEVTPQSRAVAEEPRTVEQGMPDSIDWGQGLRNLGSAAWNNVVKPAMETLNAANEWVINNPYTGAVNLQGLGREAAGWELISQEIGPDSKRLEELAARAANGDESVLPEMQALDANIKRKLAAMPGAGASTPRERLLAAGEANPDKSLENVGQFTQGVVATALAPSLASGTVRNIAAAAIDPVGQATGAVLEAPGRAIEAVPELASRARSALDANASRVAAADARAAESGSTAVNAALGSLPEPVRGPKTVEVLQEELGAAQRAAQSARRFGDDAAVAQARNEAARIESDLADAMNARRDLEPRIRSEVGRRIEDAPTAADPRSAEDAMRARFPDEQVRANPDDLSGPISVPVDAGASRLNAGAGTVPPSAPTDRLATVNRVLGQGLASAASGGTAAAAAEQLGDPNDPNRGVKAFVAGALVPQLLTRGARRLATAAGKEAGATEGALATFGSLPGSLTSRWQAATARAAKQAAAARAAGMAPPPTAMDWVRAVGYSGMIGPSTGIVNAVGNGTELLWHLPKDALRAVARGKPGEAAFEGKGLVVGLMRAGGEMLDALAGAHPGGGVETARLSQRTTSPIASFAANLLESPTRIFSEVPDAFYRSVSRTMGEYREAAQIASDMGLTGQKWSSYVDVLLKDAEYVKSHPGTKATSANIQRVLDGGEKLGERLTLRGEVGAKGQAVSDLVRATGPLGHLFVPFFNTPYQMTQRMLERTPVGLKMGTQPARFDRVYDVIAGSLLIGGMGALATGGLITGSGPDDPEKRKAMQAQGWQSNSTLVGGVWVPNNAFGVFGPIMDTAGEIGDAVRYGKDLGFNRETMIDARKRAGKIVTNQAYLRGLSDILKAIESPGEQGEAWAASTLGRAVPMGASLRLGATAEDPYERRTDPAKDVGTIENVRQRVGRSIPNELPNPLVPTRGQLPVDQDILGRPVENERAGVAAFGPRTRTPRPDPVLQSFQAAGVDIGSPRSDVMDDGVKIDLSPAETRRWNELRGQRVIQQTQRLIDGGILDRLTPARRTERLEEIKTDASDYATNAVRREIGGPEWSRRRREARQKGAA